MRQLLLAFSLTLGGCGYTVVTPDLGTFRSMDIPVAENATRWRGLETTLTRQLRNEAQQLLPVTLTTEDPDYILKTSLHEVQRGAPVRDRQGGALLGTAQLRLDWNLESSSGTSITGGSLTQSLEYVPSLGESLETTFSEMLRWLSKSVVMEVNAGLTLPAS